MAARLRTIYGEKYVHRRKEVMRDEAKAIVEDASVIYAVEQSEIEIPSFDNQRRLVCVMRFEKILPKQ